MKTVFIWYKHLIYNIIVHQYIRQLEDTHIHMYYQTNADQNICENSLVFYVRKRNSRITYVYC